MKTILLLTDFSANADTALSYAMTLAKNTNSKLILFHAYQVPVPMGEVSFAVLNDERQLMKADANIKLKHLTTRIDFEGNINYNYISEEGDAVDTILRVAEERKVDLIILGMTGENILSSAIFGNTSLKVMEKAHCPVMSIPEDMQTGKIIRRIAYATDYRRSDFAAINRAAEIAKSSEAQLTILHISSEGQEPDLEKGLMHHFMDKVRETTAYTNLSFQILQGDTIEECLEIYIEEGSADMLMMATHHRTFMERILGKGITREIAKNAIIPIVAFHYNPKTSVKLI